MNEWLSRSWYLGIDIFFDVCHAYLALDVLLTFVTRNLIKLVLIILKNLHISKLKRSVSVFARLTSKRLSAFNIVIDGITFKATFITSVNHVRLQILDLFCYPPSGGISFLVENEIDF